MIDGKRWVSGADIPRSWKSTDLGISPSVQHLMTIRPYTLQLDGHIYITLNSVAHVLNKAGISASITQQFVNRIQAMLQTEEFQFMSMGQQLLRDYAIACNVTYDSSSSSDDSDGDHKRRRCRIDNGTHFLDTPKTFVQMTEAQQVAITNESWILVCGNSKHGRLHGWSVIGQYLLDMGDTMTDEEYQIASLTFAYMTKSLSINNLEMYKAIQIHVAQTCYPTNGRRFGVMDGQMNWLRRKIDSLNNEIVRLRSRRH